MRRIAFLSAAAALVMAFGLSGPAMAQFSFPWDGSDLKGYWHFDTNSDMEDALDGSSNGNDGTLENGADRSTDIPNTVTNPPNNVNSVLLDGSDDHVRRADQGFCGGDV